jgi:hypothetical protein
MARKGVVAKKPLKEHDRRPIRWRKYPHLFLIVCEDQNTEPYYFERFTNLFPEETVFLRTVGTGRSALGVVEQCIIERNKLAEESNKNVDETWAVFDKDDADIVPANTIRFNEAFRIAQEGKISVAYSNEVFELWLLLHLEDVDSAIAVPRLQIYSRLEDAIRRFPGYNTFQYQHGNTGVIDAMLVYGDESLAILRAERILAEQRERGRRPIDANPSTTVHILVKRLRELIEWYSYEPE